MKTAIVSALPGELKPAYNHVKIKSERKIHGFKIISASYNGNELLLSFSGIGKVNMSILTAILALKLNVGKALLVGTLGSATPKLRVGMLLVPDIIAFYDQCLETDLGSIHFASYDKLPRSLRGFKPSKDVFDALIRAAENLEVNYVKGTLLTMDKFTAKRSALRDIRMNVLRRVVGVDMESAAFAQVCERFRIRYGVVKVVTDIVGPTSPLRFILNFKRLTPLPVYVALKALHMVESRE